MQRNFFEEADVELLDWVAQSPDLNPIEHLRSKIKLELKNITDSNKNQRKEQILEVWNSISPEFLLKLAKSMPKRLKQAIQQKKVARTY